MSQILWRGEWRNAADLRTLVGALGSEMARALPAPLALATVLDAAEKLAADLRNPGAPRERLLHCLADESDPPASTEARARGMAENVATLAELAAFLDRGELLRKVARELAGGSATAAPDRFERIDYRADVLERWAPLGFLVHIAPTNAANVPFLSVIEGLLAGNVNFLKLGGGAAAAPADGDPAAAGARPQAYALECLRALAQADRTGRLAEFIYAARIPSRDRATLRSLLEGADGVAIWGAEEAIDGIRELAPKHARLIEWGPKLSFAYVSHAAAGASAKSGRSDLQDRLARDICAFDQQACANPQVVYLEPASPESAEAELREFAVGLGAALTRETVARPPLREPSPEERAEITKVVRLAQVESALPAEGGELAPREVRVAPEWRILIDTNPGLKASPLYRTIWLKPLARAAIVATLRPLRHYLQTVGLSATAGEAGELAQDLVRAGALRITPVGDMLGGYTGEPHDGSYALERYSRRVSLRLGEGLRLAPQGRGPAALETAPRNAPGNAPAPDTSSPTLSKEDFAQRPVAPQDSELFFKSGGSSGQPVLSVFTYDDYHLQMKYAAQGLFASGLDPARDRCMNLFFGGGLYGGFLSFFTILEHLQAPQFPMAAHADLEFVARTIAAQGVTTLLGMPSYLFALFHGQREILAAYRGVKKIFYGGEHFGEEQREFLRREFGVELIRSAAYGSNDIGPMGFQCAACPGSVHHLQSALQSLEILPQEGQGPLKRGEAGRLVFTSRARRGQRIARYEIGDIGRWVAEGTDAPCACGSWAPKFELLGRSGDVFRAAGMFLNYGKITAAARLGAGFAGELQVTIEPADLTAGRPTELLQVDYAGGEALPPPEKMREACLREYPELRELVGQERTLELVCRLRDPAALIRTPGSGKLKRVIDRRPTGLGGIPEGKI